MGAFGWLQENIAELLNAAGIVGGLLFTAFSFRVQARERRLSNLIALTQAHREIWARLYDEPDLSRIREKKVDLSNCPATEKEKLFLTSLILHLNCVYRAITLGMFPELEGLRRDIREFYSLPIPQAIWERLRPLQDRDFVAFVESTLKKRRQRGCLIWRFCR